MYSISLLCVYWHLYFLFFGEPYLELLPILSLVSYQHVQILCMLFKLAICVVNPFSRTLFAFNFIFIESNLLTLSAFMIFIFHIMLTMVMFDVVFQFSIESFGPCCSHCTTTFLQA